MARADEPWPTEGGRPRLPLLQVRISELPVVPDALSGLALLTVFVGPQLPVGTPAANGSGWLLRAYEALDGLAPAPDAPRCELKPFPVRWRLAEKDGEGTKVGGRARYIQEKPDQDMGVFVLQIGSEPKAHWQWGDGGQGYVCRTASGLWSLHWDCF